jgi:predicted NAD/FAD-dependent oxidoreductase
MTAIAKYMSIGLEIQFNSEVKSIETKDDLWLLHSAEQFEADAVLLTPPVPQSLDLLKQISLPVSDEKRSLLEKSAYDRCLAVMARPAKPFTIPFPGFISCPSENIGWIADNQTKGISTAPALTLHGSAQFSLQNWNNNRTETAELLIQEAKEYLKIDVVELQIHAWKYSRPLHIFEQRSVEIWPKPQMVLAGDAFGGSRVEGAVLSGWDAAERIEANLRNGRT